MKPDTNFTRNFHDSPGPDFVFGIREGHDTRCSTSVWQQAGTGFQLRIPTHPSHHLCWNDRDAGDPVVGRFHPMPRDCFLITSSTPEQ
jgi:hypothetical protein